MGMQPSRLVDDAENVTYKTYGRGGAPANANNYCNIYRFGNVRIIRFKYTDSTASETIFSLDAIDTPVEAINFIAGDTSYQTRVSLNTTPSLVASGAHTGGVWGMCTYVVKATSV